MNYLLHVSRQRGAESELLVAYRFITAKRLPAWPIVPCAYDLLIDTGDTIQRVQVKTAHAHTGGTFRVRLTKRNAKGDRPIYVDAVDFVCVVCTPNCIYVVPTAVLRSPHNPAILCAQLQIGVESRLAIYKNAFAVGSGYGTGDAGLPERMDIKEFWAPAQRQHEQTGGGIRKQRVSLEQINVLRRELGEHPTTAQLEEAAVRLHVTTITIRNYLNGKRKDLRGA